MSTLSKKVHQDCTKSSTGFCISCEVFPPRSQRGLFRLLDHVIELQSFSPSYMSVTYGAGGSTRARSLKTAAAIASLQNVPVAGHLTARGHSRSELQERAKDYLASGIKHFIAIRGDAAEGSSPEDCPSTAQLVADLRSLDVSSIGVAAYPEKHPLARNWDADIDALAAKFDAGADHAISQFFFDNNHYFEFLDRLRKRRLDQPIIPGILLIHDFEKVRHFSQRCGAKLPDWAVNRYHGLEGDLETQKLVSVGLAIEQVLDLAARGVKKFHFYTFNRSDLAVAVCRSLGMPIELADAA